MTVELDMSPDGMDAEARAVAAPLDPWLARRLHGFGAKLTALQSQEVRGLLHSADSMAWSFAARKAGRDANSWREAAAVAARIRQGRAIARRPMEDLWAA